MNINRIVASILAVIILSSTLLGMILGFTLIGGEVLSVTQSLSVFLGFVAIFSLVVMFTEVDVKKQL